MATPISSTANGIAGPDDQRGANDALAVGDTVDVVGGAMFGMDDPEVVFPAPAHPAANRMLRTIAPPAVARRPGRRIAPRPAALYPAWVEDSVPDAAFEATFRRSSVAVAGLALVGALSTAVAHPGTKPVAEVSWSGGSVAVIDGSVSANRDRGAGHLSIRNTSAGYVQIVAATSPVATSVRWTTARQVVTLETLFSAGSVCAPNSSVEQAAAEQAAGLRDLIVPARSTLHLRSGTDELILDGLAPTLAPGDPVEVDLILGGPTVPAGTRLVTMLPLR